MRAARGDFSAPAPRRAAARGAVFRRKTVAWLVAITAASLAAALVFMAFAGQMSAGDSSQADAFSRSSIGYRALVELLDEAGVEVVVSRFRSAQKAGPTAPLLVAEPIFIASRASAEGDPRPERPEPDERPGGTAGPGDSRAQGLADVAAAAEARGAPVVVVLPKWYGGPSGDRDGWIGALDERESDAEAALEAVAPGCALTWPGAQPAAFSTSLPGGELPTLSDPQLVHAGCDLDPLVWSADGVLVGRVPHRLVVVVADPDLLNTHGLSRGDNPVLAHRLFVDHLGAESLVIDEVLHGFYKPPSIWTELLTLPLLPVTLHVLALTLLALAAAAVRFGRPEPSPPRVPPGKRALVDSTAELLDGGGHHAESLRHYLRLTLRHTAAALGVPAGPGADPVGPLASLARARGVRSDITAIAGQIDALPPGGGEGAAARALALAAALDRWRKEMMHGFR